MQNANIVNCLAEEVKAFPECNAQQSAYVYKKPHNVNFDLKYNVNFKLKLD